MENLMVQVAYQVDTLIVQITPTQLRPYNGQSMSAEWGIRVFLEVK